MGYLRRQSGATCRSSDPVLWGCGMCKPDELWTVQSLEGKAGPVQVNGQSRPMWVRTVGLRPAQRASTCLAPGWGN